MKNQACFSRKQDYYARIPKSSLGKRTKTTFQFFKMRGGVSSKEVLF